MTKERRTVSLEKDVEDYLASEGVNASELVNKLVKQHASAGGNERAMLELRKDQILSDINSLEGRIESKQEELERVQARLDEHESEKDQILSEATEALSITDLREENRKVEYWAEEMDMSVSEFIDRIEGRL